MISHGESVKDKGLSKTQSAQPAPFSGAKGPLSSARGLLATLEQPRCFHPICPGGESRRRTAPAQRLDLFEERRIGAQGREILEEQCEIASLAENV